ncbi:MAG: bifunctional 5,10-methylene-tetrahydrofolate dehydrogenase/5,10-methylene-tetrahydrofolate cyclohydrolase [Alicyclobacillus macrosporangiidus]|uniref:bifunctional 5,10-methylenetetrahydrofolate dehydrogenase/5,10-methenyltetrahydrofolate cyclohydrolase n=1 Tax=Alicyclobacillus TaxID=29330 RepID=UPI0004141FB8|nr:MULTISPECIES: tetrahydrofolate dehydrogenase/cyclohydrolase catalytic domain-containing protein [Alicyclobacillus]MCL6597889.1 bifunctional 5,10-methylene-tetrahydrofolate dehydrogenase/5,10-methylene-tetrahydrofolate cyclohydrolase [Alicyclobacillus macrosporangiidus]
MSEPTILYGKPVVNQIHEDIRRRLETLKNNGVTPCLATILVGDDPASATYVRMKGNACRRLGLTSRPIHLPSSTDTETLIRTIHDLNDDPSVHGILLQHPVPAGIDERAAFDAIRLDKDVDGVTSAGFGLTAFDRPGHRSCTPEGILHILDFYHIPLRGKHAVVLGRSAILGKPVAAMLLNRDCTVTICHSKTEQVADLVRQADILIAAVGRPRYVQGSWLKPGAVVIDAGYNEGNIGDVDFDSCLPRAGAITPVPGGVGPVTIATLLQHTVHAAEQASLSTV